MPVIKGGIVTDYYFGRKKQCNKKPNRNRFYYYLPPQSGEERYLQTVSVVGGSEQVRFTADSATGTLNHKIFNKTTGACAENEWKKCTLTFFTGKDTAVWFCLRYIAPAATGARIYLDDLVLLYDPLAEPEFTNLDLKLNNGFPYLMGNISAELQQQNGKRQTKLTSTAGFRFASSSGITLTKGRSYTFSFSVDLTDYPLYTAATAETENPVAAYVDFSILNDQKNYNAKYIVGPNQGSIETGDGLLRYFLEYLKNHPEDKGMIDVLSTHMYSRTYSLSINEKNYYYDMADNAFADYRSVLDEYDYDGEFLVDEYFAYSPIDGYWTTNNGVQLTQVAAGVAAAVKNGLDRLLSWQIFDQLWVNANLTNGDFIGGVHALGTAPSFVPNPHKDYAPYASETPRVTYYGLNLLGKYLSNQKALTYYTQSTAENGLYTAAIRGDDGKTVVLVVNTQSTAVNVALNFEKQMNMNFYRYAYCPTAVTSSPNATSIAYDTVFQNISQRLTDTLPPQSFALYVSEKGYFGDDVECDMAEVQ